jgi:D-serine deaminase-like pyridoxal phosphate-dependent protein
MSGCGASAWPRQTKPSPSRRVRALPPLRYRGIAFYPGHVRQHLTRQDDALARLRDDLAHWLSALGSAGLPPEVVSGGSTPAPGGCTR